LKKTRMERRREKRSVRRALKQELREHRNSFIVFYILRALVIVTLVRQLLRGDYESAFLCILTFLLLYVPSWLQVRLSVELPPTLEIIILCFIFAAEILGEVNAFYVLIPGWDAMLHTINGFLAAAVGFSMVMILNDNKKLTFDLSPFFLAMVAFCFSMTIGVLWEIFEFFMDMVFHFDMQKDVVVHGIYSVMLDPTNSNTVISMPGIREVTVNGQDLGLGGYLDIGIIDTMKDLIVNFIGAAVFSAIGFFYASSKGRKQKAAESFLPSKKEAARDYLRQTREEHNRMETVSSCDEEQNNT